MSDPLLILAPRGRDAVVVEQVLARQSIDGLICADLASLRRNLDDDTGGVIVTEEALAGPDLAALLEWCDRQPPWSDLPVVVLATRQGGQRPAPAARILERLGNVVLLERPVNAETLASAGRSVLRARRRQHQARALLQQRERNERELRELNDTLERRVDERARALDRARAALAFALDAAGMGSFDLDLAADRSLRSPQHDRIFGHDVPLASWGRADFLQHIHAEDRPEAGRALAAAERDGTLDLQCRIVWPDSAIRWIVAKGRVGHDENGRASRITGVIMDITDRRSIEDALHQAQKMEAIGQLTGGVAHDFNNLLTVIVGGLELISRKPERTDRVVRLAEAAMNAARRGEELTRQLLAFSRRQTLRPRTVQPNRLLAECRALAERAVGATVDLLFDLDPQAGPIHVDEAQFESAVLNLIVNARDAMPAGGRVTVTSRNAERATPALPSGPYVAIGVADTGTGFDAQTLARAFEPFFTTKDIGKGSGLGLSQVYGFTRGAGGDVAVDTALGRGTVMTLYFPRSSRRPDEYSAVPDGAPAPADAGQTVLLVEDDEQVLGMAVETLQELHYRVLVAHDAREALDRIAGPERIDLMFSDVVMPGEMNGAQLAAEARRLRPGLKILLTSGYVGDSGAAPIETEKFQMLAKPYRRSQLAERLQAILAGEARA